MSADKPMTDEEIAGYCWDALFKESLSENPLLDAQGEAEARAHYVANSTSRPNVISELRKLVESGAL